MEYKLVRSGRKTLAVEIKPDGSVVVRVPDRCSSKVVAQFIEKHREWIGQKQQEQSDRMERKTEVLSEEKRQAMIGAAKTTFPARVQFYAARMQVDYGRITIREQKTRWGSCSARGNLNFNWRLMMAPEPVRDYVVVHELAHRKFMNHSKDFYAVVAGAMPDYKTQQKWLRENGWKIL